MNIQKNGRPDGQGVEAYALKGFTYTVIAVTLVTTAFFVSVDLFSALYPPDPLPPKYHPPTIGEAITEGILGGGWVGFVAGACAGVGVAFVRMRKKT
jgi:hypothetical protein